MYKALLHLATIVGAPHSSGFLHKNTPNSTFDRILKVGVVIPLIFPKLPPPGQNP